MAPGFLKSVKIGGVIEIEGTNSEDFSGNDTGDLALAKVEVNIDAQPTEFISTHAQLQYEDGSSNVTLDEAYIALDNTSKFPVYLKAGKWTLPFGGYFGTNMSTDPLTKSLGKIKENAVLVGGVAGDLKVEW